MTGRPMIPRAWWLAIVPTGLALGVLVAMIVNVLPDVPVASPLTRTGVNPVTSGNVYSYAPRTEPVRPRTTTVRAVPRTVTVTPRTPAPAPVVIALPAGPYYADCDAVRAAGVAPLHRGAPGYREALNADPEDDDTACDGRTSTPSTTSTPTSSSSPPSSSASPTTTSAPPTTPDDDT